jgi:capsular exopolysaccharide synthesis family protein
MSRSRQDSPQRIAGVAQLTPFPPSSRYGGISPADPGNAKPGARALAILRRNWALILTCLIVVPAAALAFSLAQDKEYTATASLLFRDPGLDERFFGGASLAPEDADPGRVAATNLRLVSLRGIAQRTARELDRPGLTAEVVQGKVQVVPEGESDIIAVEATNGSPRFAAALANTFARQYIQFRREADQAKVEEAQRLIQSQLDALSPEEATTPEALELARQARELEILASLQTGNAELVQPAVPPEEPSAPKTARNVALGILLGIVLAIALALLRELLNRRLTEPAEVAAIFDLPILASIPESRAISRSAEARGMAASGAEGEAFRMLRTNLRYFNIDHEIKSLLVTSAAPQDGKTTVSWNLALAEAQAGKSVLYIEADLRRPTVGQQLGLVSPRGLSLVLAGVQDIATALENVQGVHVLLAGPLPPNPAELVDSQRMRELIAWGEEHYDRVIIDTPPVSFVADAIPIVNEVTGVVVVVRLGRSHRDAAERLHDQLSNVNAPVLGVVMNGASTRRSSYYYRGPGVGGLFADPLQEDILPPGPREVEASAATRSAGRGGSQPR